MYNVRYKSWSITVIDRGPSAMLLWHSSRLCVSCYWQYWWQWWSCTHHILNTPVVVMHVRWNYCNMETLHLVDVYIYIHCVIGKQCSVLDTWLRGSVAPHCGHLSRQGRWQQNTETCELWFCNEVGKPNGTSYLDRSPGLHKSPRSILGSWTVPTNSISRLCVN